MISKEDRARKRRMSKLSSDYARLQSEEWEEGIKRHIAIRKRFNDPEFNTVVGELIKLDTAIMTGYKMVADGLDAMMVMEQVLWDMMERS